MCLWGYGVAPNMLKFKFYTCFAFMCVLTLLGFKGLGPLGDSA
ncbi:hypothetical protein HHE02_11030 [Helicobacter heilmannii]|nr:hypothetical protein HHE014_13410 [Helicobacter heilmannii]CRF47808.1 hypothetical protein HHE02_11030 [Helicobacter heilmannii]